ncbi:hypothetical protein SeLEV6574_g01470 [Synchytrium endobioticum]|uniref:Uncharacterized protein n=1 Tax=Synchytrium endobioticum TaxID=286115 RepID=A0A507DDW3_9FUNG|nr:hypothetical protein SeLEV6574_g01470 [Synchytrium endobioticum]
MKLLSAILSILAASSLVSAACNCLCCSGVLCNPQVVGLLPPHYSLLDTSCLLAYPSNCFTGVGQTALVSCGAYRIVMLASCAAFIYVCRRRGIVMGKPRSMHLSATGTHIQQESERSTPQRPSANGAYHQHPVFQPPLQQPPYYATPGSTSYPQPNYAPPPAYSSNGFVPGKN